jgi:predicted CopG family antitoxin
MFESYKGFDVICRYEDPKKKEVTEILGRLHDRTDETTVINIKGRMKKIKNESIESLKLPKAKKEKGSK